MSQNPSDMMPLGEINAVPQPEDPFSHLVEPTYVLVEEMCVNMHEHSVQASIANNVNLSTKIKSELVAVLKDLPENDRYNVIGAISTHYLANHATTH